MIKLFEEFNEIDPYNEENWDNLTINDIEVGDIIHGALAIFKVVEKEGYKIKLEYADTWMKMKLPIVEFNFDEIKELIYNGTCRLEKKIIKMFEDFNSDDPYNEEKWEDTHYSDDPITNKLMNILMDMNIDERDSAKLYKVGKRNMYLIYDPDTMYGMFEGRSGEEARALCSIQEGRLSFLWYCDFKLIPVDKVIEIQKAAEKEFGKCPVYRIEDILK